MIDFTMCNKTLYNKIFETCKSFKVISFDLFDTIVFRPYNQPSDLFLDISQFTNHDEFHDIRTKAEKQASKTLNKEISIDDIYNFIPQKFKNLQKIEEDYEVQIAKPNQVILQIIKDLYNLDKKIIVTTDMYLKSETIMKIINKLELTPYIYKIYISNTLNKSKHNGDLFDYIIHDFNILKNDFIHIGDNIKSDFTIPTTKGLHAIKINKINDDISLFYTESFNKKLNINKYCSLCKYYKHSNNNYWNQIGYMLGGPIAISFIRYIQKIQKLQNIKALWFIARDGYILKQLYEQMFEDHVQCEYVFASRGLLNNAKTSINACNEYIQYITSLKSYNETKIGIIDLTTLNFSVQDFLNTHFKNLDIFGIYWLANLNNLKYNYSSMFYRPSIISPINFLIETLITAPHPPVNQIQNCQPAYEIANEQENLRCKIYNQIASGINDFANDLKNTFNYNLDFSNNDLENILINWLTHHTAVDAEFFTQISHSGDLKNLNNINLDTYLKDCAMPKITVIIPVYNVEKYLEQCLNSVINQTLEFIEIICINDGSTDKSLDILNQYAEKDSRIKIINQNNSGLATSRNNALKIAHGKYCAFLDSDDLLDKNALYELYHYAEKNKLDMLAFSGYNFDTTHQKIDNPYWSFSYLPKNWHKTVFTYKDCLSFMHRMAVSSCLTIYRKDFIDKNKLTFPDGLVYEDNVFWTVAFTKNARFGILNKKFYQRRLHDESITSNWKKNLSDYIKISTKVLEYLKSIHINNLTYKNYKQQRIKIIKQRFDQLTVSEKKEIEKLVSEFMKKYK